MSNSLYVAAIEPASGKSLVVLGIAELLSRRVDKLGFFRPVTMGEDGHDEDIDLIRSRYSLNLPYESLYGMSYDEALDLASAGREQEIVSAIVAKYKELQEQCDFILCEGTDLSGASSAFEFQFNARIASHLGSPVMVVGSGREKTVESTLDVMHTARRAFSSEHCTIAGSIINRVDPVILWEAREMLEKEFGDGPPVLLIPENDFIASPTVQEILTTLNGRLLNREPTDLSREALDFKIAAMRLENFLNHIEDGTLVICPGDRADIILGCLATAYSRNYGKIAGLVLTGGIELAPEIVKLIKGFTKVPMPLIMVESDTHNTSMHIDNIRAGITSDNPRKINTVLEHFEKHVDVEALASRIEVTRSSSMTPMMFVYDLINKAKVSRQRIVLPEGTEERVLRATEILLRKEVAQITLLGNEEKIRNKIATWGLDMDDAVIIDPEQSKIRTRFASVYVEMRKNKGMTYEAAMDEMLDVNYFGTMMVHQDLADGMVSGSVHTTAQTIRPVLQIIRTGENFSIASSVFFMCMPDRVLVYGDCVVNTNPNSQELADIAIASADTAATFGIEPRVAMLSYSTGQSGYGDDVETVKEATSIIRQLRPDLKVEGPIQYDAAVDAGVAKTKLPDSEVAGKASVLIFPDLNTGNNTYKAVQRSAGALVVGPVFQGLRKPVNDLSRGCTVEDIVNTVAITAIQAQMMDTAREGCELTTAI